MNWLWSFLLWKNPAPDGGVIEAVRFPRLETPVLAALFFVLLIGGIGLIRWCYRRDADYVVPRRKRVLMIARSLALAVVLFIATGAFLEISRRFEGKGTVMYLTDQSASMALVDKTEGGGQAAGSRQALLKAAFADPKRDPVRQLDRLFKAEGYTFGAAPAVAPLELSTDAKDGPLARLSAPEEKATQLGAALADAARRARGRRLDAVVLLSDGGWNRGEDPVAVAKSLGAPVIAVGVGAPQAKDLEIPFLSCEEVVFKNDRFPLDVRVRQRGFSGRSVALVIRRTDDAGREEVVKEEQLQLGEDREFVHTVELVPDKEGVFTYTAELVPQPEESNTVNNRKSKANIRVVDQKLRVLAVDESPRWEFRFLRAILEADKQRVKPTLLLRQADRGAETRGVSFITRFPATPKALAELDCIVLGDVAPDLFGTDDLKALEEWVRKDGGGLIVVAGRRHMPDRYEGTPLEKLLPVENEPTPSMSVADETARTIKQGFRPQVTPEGSRYAALRFASDPGENESLWARCEPLMWVHPIRRAKSGAAALLVHPDKKAGDQPLPILSLQRYGRGVVIYLATDESWRWRFLPGAAQHRRWWGQLCAAAGMSHLLGHASRVQLETDRGEYAVGDRAQVVARVMDADYNPLAADTVTAVVERELSSEKIQLAARRDQPGVFSGEWVPAATGKFRISVTAGDGVEAQDERTVSVIEAQLEADDAGMREDLLRQVAQTSGGAYLPLSDIDQVAKIVSARERAGALKREELTLWNAPGVMLLLALLLGFEWFWRKRWDML